MKKFESIVVVDNWGVIEPSFRIDSTHITSGKLKYLQMFKGKKIKVTIEVLDD